MVKAENGRDKLITKSFKKIDGTFFTTQVPTGEDEKPVKPTVGELAKEYFRKLEDIGYTVKPEDVKFWHDGYTAAEADFKRAKMYIQSIISEQSDDHDLIHVTGKGDYISLDHLYKAFGDLPDFEADFKKKVLELVDRCLDDAMVKIEQNNPDNSDSFQREQSSDYFICAGASEFSAIFSTLLKNQIEKL